MCNLNKTIKFLLREMFSEDISLIDWEIKAFGIDQVVEQNLKTVLNTALNSLCNLRQGKISIQKLEKFEKSIKMLIKNLDYLLGGYLKSN